MRSEDNYSAWTYEEEANFLKCMYQKDNYIELLSGYISGMKKRDKCSFNKERAIELARHLMSRSKFDE